MTQHNSRLLLVYNADGGIINALKDAIHKQISPSTYPCSLCALTYGAVSMRGEWKRFLDSLRMEIVFHHRDDFAAAFPGHSFQLPAILLSENGNPPHVLIPTEELGVMEDAAELIDRVGERLEIERGRGAPIKAAA